MTSKNQIRSVLMTLLMVTSVFAGVVAFSGTAAADVTGVTAGSNSVEQGSTVSVTVDYNGGTNDTIQVVASQDNQFDDGELVSTLPGDASNTSSTSWDTSGLATGDYTIYAFNSSAAPSPGDTLSGETAAVSVTAPSPSVETDEGDVLFIGETGQFNADSSYRLYRETGNDANQFISELSENQTTGLVDVSTSGLEDGTYYVGQNNTDEAISFQLAEHTLTASVDPTNVTTEESTNFTLDSNRNDYNVTVSADGLSTSALESIFGAQGAETDNGYELNISTQNADVAADFSNGASTGSYDFEFNAVDTDASASASVNVSEAGDTGASFENNVVSEQVGDVAVLTVNLANTNDVELAIGTNESVSYKFNATVSDGNDDGKVTLLYNTYYAGNPNNNAGEPVIQTANDEDSVNVHLNPELGDNGQPLAAGDYPLSLSTSGGTELGVGTLVLNQRSTDGISVWSAPGTGTTLSDVDELDEITSSVSNTSEIAEDDYVVLQVQASGLYGYLNETNLNATGDDGLSLAITQSNAPPNSDGNTIYANDTVVADSENNTFFAVVDASEFSSGGEYEATFTVNETSPYVADEDATESVSTEFSVVDTDAEFTYNGDQLVLGGSNAQLSGSTSLAPGTELTLRVQSNDNANPFLKTATAEVQQDGSFNATFDMSGIPQDTEFTASIGQPSVLDTSSISETGVIGEAPDTTSEPTQTTQVTETTTTEQTTTETTTPTPDETTTTEGTTTSNDGGQPGFGIVAALIALVAAALIAVRRD